MVNHYFIGIKIPLTTARSLVEQRDSWNLSSHKRLPVAEDLHITLLFLGGDPHDEIGEVAKALEEVAHGSFSVDIAGTGYFGKMERPRVVYAATEENDSLNRLQLKIRDILKGFQLSPDNKPFVPHITLANKWAGNEPWNGIPELETGRFEVGEFSLFQIEPVQTPRYIAVQNYKLKDGV
ncbi:RNA 2',3'-cyclic phosphodiesterase [Planococcus sp. MERTA32b]|nr:RNA 2',3'-cyclic phosphodiesterase [Planococcus sp. MER TA 32b]